MFGREGHAAPSLPPSSTPSPPVLAPPRASGCQHTSGLRESEGEERRPISTGPRRFLGYLLKKINVTEAISGREYLCQCRQSEVRSVIGDLASGLTIIFTAQVANSRRLSFVSFCQRRPLSASLLLVLSFFLLLFLLRKEFQELGAAGKGRKFMSTPMPLCTPLMYDFLSFFSSLFLFLYLYFSFLLCLSVFHRS